LHASTSVVRFCKEKCSFDPLVSDLFRLFEKRCSFAEDAFGPDSQLQEALELRLREAEERRRGGQAVAQVQRHHDGRPLFFSFFFITIIKRLVTNQ